MRSSQGEVRSATLGTLAGASTAQCFVGWEELVAAGLDFAELATADVVGQMLDVNLDPRAVGRKQVAQIESIRSQLS